MDFSYILKKRNDIHEKISLLYNASNIEEYWISDNFNSEVSDYNFAGGDGSFNKIDYIDYCLYSVGVISYTNKVGESIKESLKYWDIDIMQPYKYVSNRLRLNMLNMELKTVLWNFINKDIDYYLFDGSLYSLLIQTHTYGYGMGYNSDESIVDYYKEYNSEIKNKIYYQLKNNELSPIYEYGDDKKILFEQLEYIILLVEILKKYGDRLIGISKTSKMNLYFTDSNIPDIAIFSKVANSGYSKPFNLTKNSIKSINENIYNTITNFKNIYPIKNLYYQFLKLEDNSGIINITTTNKLNSKFFSSLKRISISGYPYILKKSHENVKITDKDMQLCAKLLGIYKKVDRDIIL